MARGHALYSILQCSRTRSGAMRGDLALASSGTPTRRGRCMFWADLGGGLLRRGEGGGQDRLPHLV